MRKIVALAMIGLVLAGCETTDGKPQPVSMKSLPEFGAHMDCLAAQARTYARTEGSPLELGIIGSSACGKTRYALYDAITKVESRTFARSYIATGEKEEPKMIAAEIIRLRGR